MPRTPFKVSASQILGSLLSTGHLRFQLTKGSVRTLLNVHRVTQNVETEIYTKFPPIMEAWAETFNANLGAVIRGSMKPRTGEMEETTRIIQTGTGVSKNTIWWKYSVDPAAGNFGKKVGLEMGRNKGEGTVKKKYLVPLVSWMKSQGLYEKGVTSRRMRDDLKQGFFQIPVNTKAGPAKMYLRHKPKEVRAAKARATARKLQKKGERARKPLKEIAEAMYLAYDKTTGIYGDSYPEYTTTARGGLPRPLSGQFAGLFGINVTKNSPRWFSRAQVRYLGELYRGLLNPRSISFDAFLRASRGGYGGDEIDVLMNADVLKRHVKYTRPEY